MPSESMTGDGARRHDPVTAILAVTVAALAIMTCALLLPGRDGMPAGAVVSPVDESWGICDDGSATWGIAHVDGRWFEVGDGDGTHRASVYTYHTCPDGVTRLHRSLVTELDIACDAEGEAAAWAELVPSDGGNLLVLHLPGEADGQRSVDSA